jgi:hypothetical protein
MCRKTCCFSVLSSKRAGEHVPSLGRKIGWVRRIGHVESYRFASRNSSARAVFERARPRDAVSSAQSGSRTGVLALHQPSLGRKIGWVRPIRRIKISRFWLKNCRARPGSGRARTTTAAVEKPVQGTLSRPRRILSAARAARPPANPPGARPPACLPVARPTERRARTRRLHLLRARACCTARCTARWTTLVCRFVCRLQERTPAHGWRASPTAPSAHCRAWACAPWPAPPSPALPGPPRWCPAPPRLASLGRARPAPTCPAPLVPPRPTRPGAGQVCARGNLRPAGKRRGPPTSAEARPQAQRPARSRCWAAPDPTLPRPPAGPPASATTRVTLDSSNVTYMTRIIGSAPAAGTN